MVVTIAKRSTGALLSVFLVICVVLALVGTYTRTVHAEEVENGGSCTAEGGGGSEQCANDGQGGIAEEQAQAIKVLDGMLMNVLGAELTSRMMQLGKFSNSEDKMDRSFLTPAWFKASELLQKWMKDAGLEVTIDGTYHVTAFSTYATHSMLYELH